MALTANLPRVGDGGWVISSSSSNSLFPTARSRLPKGEFERCDMEISEPARAPNATPLTTLFSFWNTAGKKPPVLEG